MRKRDKFLMKAIALKDLNQMRFALSFLKANFKVKDEEGITPLMLAAYQGNTEILEGILSQEGIDFSRKDENGIDAFGWALRGGHIESIRLLLEDKRFKKSEIEVLHQCCDEKCWKVAESLLFKFNFTKSINTPDEKGRTLLFKGITHRQKNFVRLLLENKFLDLNGCDKLGSNPFLYAIATRDLDFVNLFLSLPETEISFRNKTKDTALIISSMFRFTEGVERLIKIPSIDVNAQNIYGETALHWAVLNGDSKILKLLLSHKDIDLNLKDKHLETPLKKAVCCENYECVTLLASHPKANLFLKDENDQTVLDFAFSKKNTKIIQTLQKIKEEKNHSTSYLMNQRQYG